MRLRNLRHRRGALGKLVFNPFIYRTEIIMRKMIMMAIAGFLLKKVQSKFMKQTYHGNPVRRM
jgi:hypothetical protein